MESAIIVTMPSLELYLLGDFRILLDGQPLSGFRSDKARALLAYLAVENGRPHNRAMLATLLWGEHSDDAARTSLRSVLYNLRQVFGFMTGDASDEAGFRFTRKGVQFDPLSPPDYWCDLTDWTLDKQIKSSPWRISR